MSGKRHWKFSIEPRSNKVNLCDTRKCDRDVEGSIVFQPTPKPGKKFVCCPMCQKIGELLLKDQKGDRT